MLFQIYRLIRYYLNPNKIKEKKMSNSNNSNGGIGFIGLLTLVFITLKLTGVIEWSWIWVISPVWVPLAILAVVGILYLIPLGLLSSKKKKSR